MGILIQMNSDCIFCKIINKELPSTIEYEDDEILAFDDIDKVAPIDVLIVPKKHIAKVADATQEDEKILGKIQLIAAKIAKDKGIGESFRITNANGSDAGQSVFHIHYHLMGGWSAKMKAVYQEDK